MYLHSQSMLFCNSLFSECISGELKLKSVCKLLETVDVLVTLFLVIYSEKNCYGQHMI